MEKAKLNSILGGALLSVAAGTVSSNQDLTPMDSVNAQIRTSKKCAIRQILENSSKAESHIVLDSKGNIKSVPLHIAACCGGISPTSV